MQKSRLYGIILAAGFGTRLKPLTETIPKAAVEVAGKPLIFYALENMINSGVKKVVINTHYLADVLIQKVRSKEWPLEVIFSHEPVILGTGGGILKALGHIPEAKTILVQNADGLIEPDFDLLFSKHFSGSPLSTMVLKTVENPEEYGVVLTNDIDQVCDINGRVGYKGKASKKRMFCGLQLLQSEITNWMPKERTEFCILNNAIIPALAEGGTVLSVENEGYFFDVGTPKRLEQADALLKNRKKG